MGSGEPQFEVETDRENATDRGELVGAMSRILMQFDNRQKAAESDEAVSQPPGRLEGSRNP